CGYSRRVASVQGKHPDKVGHAAGEAIQRARQGGGPTLLELETYRLAGHFMGDAEGYRPEGEKEALQAKDPIPRYRDALLADGVLTGSQDADIIARSHAAVDEAIAFARESEYPAGEEALEKVFI